MLGIDRAGHDRDEHDQEPAAATADIAVVRGGNRSSNGSAGHDEKHEGDRRHGGIGEAQRGVEQRDDRYAHYCGDQRAGQAGRVARVTG